MSARLFSQIAELEWQVKAGRGSVPSMLLLTPRSRADSRRAPSLTALASGDQTHHQTDKSTEVAGHDGKLLHGLYKRTWAY